MLGQWHGRPARPASPAWNLAKTLAQTGVFWAVFLFLLPALVYSAESAIGLTWWRFPSLVAQIGGSLLFVVGASLGTLSGVIMAFAGHGTPLPFDCARELVLAGPYRYVRNPMAVAGLLQGVAVGIFLGSPAVALYALAGGPVWNYFVRPAEELDLLARFGDAYRVYQSEVPCWLPRRQPYHAQRSAAAPILKDAPRE